MVDWVGVSVQALKNGDGCTRGTNSRFPPNPLVTHNFSAQKGSELDGVHSFAVTPKTRIVPVLHLGGWYGCVWFVEAGYESVRQTFVSMCEQGIETGGAVSVWADGREVVNLSGGWANRGRSQQWRSDTLVHTYSTSKPFAALAALVAGTQGALELDEPVSRYRAEHGAKGKACTTLRDILTHRAGLPGFPSGADQMDLLDDYGLRRLLAEAEPESMPGSTLAEHAVTYGH